MEYGYFDNKNREYVITKPETPYPWINYLGTEDFFSLISNTGGGYCFYKDARLRRILRYRYNNTPADSTGRYFYIKEKDKFFNIGKYPAKTDLDKYECRHGLGYTVIESEKNGISAIDTTYVPVGVNCEVHSINIENRSSEVKEIDVYSYFEFCLWDALDDQSNFQRNYSIGEVKIADNMICNISEYRERRDHYSFVWCNHELEGFDTDRESFLGLYNGLDSPQVVVDGKSNNSVASGWSPIASHHVSLTLNPNEKKNIIFVLGYVENRFESKFDKDGEVNISNAKDMISKYKDEEATKQDLNCLQDYWNDKLSKYRIESDYEEINTMVNIWNQYQCMVTFNLSRSASFFESGIGRGMGFRDSNQDILGFVHQIPDRARQRLIDIAATQFEDGSAYHQYQPLTKKGNSDIGSGFNDDPLWLVLSVISYIQETGDYSILGEDIPFNTGKTAKMIDHLDVSMKHVEQNLGPHGLPLIGRADWNDCLNLNCHSTTPGQSFQIYGTADGRVAESVMIAGLYLYCGDLYVELLKRLKNEKKAGELNRLLKEMRDNIDKHGWDGEWFVRAYDANGKIIGSEQCEEGKIYIESQGWCVMAGIGKSDGRAVKAMDSVEKHLMTKHGVMLQQPAYTKYDPDLGEISSYPPGYKENAGIFCHNNSWIVCAQAELKRGNEAFEAYSKIAPAFIKETKLHRTEPYVYSQMIAGKDAKNFGEAKNSWLTGTASWCFVSISQSILGIKPDFDGIRIDPCLPDFIDEYCVHRRFRGVEYKITVLNKSKEGCSPKEIYMDGKLMDSNVILAQGVDICEVDVIL